MTQLLIEVNIGTFHFSGKTVTGVIYVGNGEYSFPESVWNDFPVIVLGWWTEAMLAFVQSRQIHTQLNFMDGPYSVILRRTNFDEIVFNCIRHNEESHEITGSLTAFVKSLKAAANSVLRYCDSVGFKNRDVLLLEENFRQLQSISNV